MWVDSYTRLLIRRETIGGHLVGFAVVLLALLEDGSWVDIARFDTAHGCPHEDILGHRGGLIEKRWHDNLSYKEAFELAVIRFRTHHATIRKQYLSR